ERVGVTAAGAMPAVEARARLEADPEPGLAVRLTHRRARAVVVERIAAPRAQPLLRARPEGTAAQAVGARAGRGAALAEREQSVLAAREVSEQAPQIALAVAREPEQLSAAEPGRVGRASRDEHRVV